MFLGNPSLKSEFEKVDFTPDLLDEYLKCKEDIVYFAENYFTIVTIDEGELKIQLREYQKRMLKAFVGGDDLDIPEEDRKKNIVCLSSRQIGKCFFGDTDVKIKNTKTGEIRVICAEEFYQKNR